MSGECDICGELGCVECLHADAERFLAREENGLCYGSSFTMTNQELAKAIEYATGVVKATGTGWPHYKPYSDHMQALLAQQLLRARARE